MNDKIPGERRPRLQITFVPTFRGLVQHFLARRVYVTKELELRRGIQTARVY